MKTRSLLATTLAAAGFALMAAPTFATPVTFAQFQQAISGNQFTFTNNTTSPNDLKLTASLPVTFKFLTSNSYGPTNAPIAATMVLTAIANPAATTAAGLDIQDFSSVSMTFTAVVPIGGHSNLLTLNAATTGAIVGTNNTQSASLNGDTLGGDTVNFSSDFLFFTPSFTDHAYTLSFTSLIPRLLRQPAGNPQRHTGYLESFTAAGTGTFAADPGPDNPVPEPSPAIALFIGAGLVLLFVRNRKIATARPLAA